MLRRLSTTYPAHHLTITAHCFDSVVSHATCPATAITCWYRISLFLPATCRSGLTNHCAACCIFFKPVFGQVLIAALEGWQTGFFLRNFFPLSSAPSGYFLFTWCSLLSQTTSRFVNSEQLLPSVCTTSLTAFGKGFLWCVCGCVGVCLWVGVGVCVGGCVCDKRRGRSLFYVAVTNASLMKNVIVFYRLKIECGPGHNSYIMPSSRIILHILNQ